MDHPPPLLLIPDTSRTFTCLRFQLHSWTLNLRVSVIKGSVVNMESVFSRFDSYKFEADERFVAGVKTVREGAELDLKLFFYNRFVEPIDRDGYKRWRTPSNHVTAPSFDQQDQRTLFHSDPDVSDNQTETRGHTETKQLSFAEVMQLVQEGKEVPGVKKLDIRASNQNPTPSKMERPLKPWETASS